MSSPSSSYLVLPMCDPGLGSISEVPQVLVGAVRPFCTIQIGCGLLFGSGCHMGTRCCGEIGKRESEERLKISRGHCLACTRELDWISWSNRISSRARVRLKKTSARMQVGVCATLLLAIVVGLCTELKAASLTFQQENTISVSKSEAQYTPDDHIYLFAADGKKKPYSYV
ncbi:hypothetical protein ElyMa_003434400 [Elysia marginata]|uniref:Uncharacterized protein n=1 Tax=Elysia marginata TaxID=1093978 RepID=A0AAV4JR36_9GAST|nr:hypothetical protein ElyMa_003434400 [Elysia marginata]